MRRVIAPERHRQLSLPPPLSAEQEIALNEARLAGDYSAREQLILSNLRLVLHLARRYAWSGISSDDLFSSGTQGLIAAVDDYDHTRGRLAPLARVHIRKEMLELIAAQRTLLRLPPSVNYHALLLTRAEARLTVSLGRDPTDTELAAESGLTVKRIETLRRALGAVVSLDDEGSGDAESNGIGLHDVLADDGAAIADATAEDTSRAEWLGRAVSRLSPREQTLVRRHFGLDGQGGLSLAQLANEIGVSRERLRQIETGALRKLRRLLQADGAHEGEDLGANDWESMLREIGVRLAV